MAEVWMIYWVKIIARCPQKSIRTNSRVQNEIFKAGWLLKRIPEFWRTAAYGKKTHLQVSQWLFYTLNLCHMSRTVQALPVQRCMSPCCVQHADFQSGNSGARVIIENGPLGTNLCSIIIYQAVIVLWCAGLWLGDERTAEGISCLPLFSGLAPGCQELQGET